MLYKDKIVVITGGAHGIGKATKEAFEEFEYAMAVGVTAPFYLSKLFYEHFADGASQAR